MAHLNKISDVRAYIISRPSLKLRDLEKKNLPEKNVEDFLQKFFTKYNSTLDTVLVDTNAKHTSKGLRRSMTDVLLICHYYFPRVSITKTYKRLCSLINSGVIVSALCNAIHMRVYRAKTNYDRGNFFNGCMTDEFGVDFEMFDLSGASFNETGWGTDYDEDNLNMIKL